MILLTIINGVLIAYLLILSLRIVLGWFAPQSLGRAWDLLAGATDPYLALFSRVRFLRGSLFDFSPIAAVLALVVVIDLLYNLIDYMRITLGFFLASVISAAWMGARFILLLFLIVGLLRTIPLLLRTSAASTVWKVVDTLMQPVVAWVTKLFRLGRGSGYTQHLLLTIGLLFVAWLLGETLVSYIIIPAFQRIPI
ncbi:MAG: YggT family protein [Spirochaetia bacterium]|jgi:YggT family protein